MSVTFYTPCATPRPVRLSEATRRFADESLHGRYGDDALRTPAVALDDPTHPDCLTPAQFAALSDCGRQDAAIAALAKYAPGVQIGACRFGGGKIAPVPDTERPQGCGGRA